MNTQERTNRINNRDAQLAFVQEQILKLKTRLKSQSVFYKTKLRDRFKLKQHVITRCSLQARVARGQF